MCSNALARRLAVQEPFKKNEVAVVKRERRQGRDRRRSTTRSATPKALKSRPKAATIRLISIWQHDEHDEQINEISDGAASRPRQGVGELDVLRSADRDHALGERQLMVVHEFIRARQDAWAQLQTFLEKARRLSLARVPLDVFREGSALYRQAVADLAYARMCFPGHPVVRELEQLVGHAHSLLYQAGRARSRNWTEFWLRHLADAHARGSPPDPRGHGNLLGQRRRGILSDRAESRCWRVSSSAPRCGRPSQAKRLWTESLTRTAPAASSQIAANNINVSLLTWGLGLTFGIGTVWLLVFNGMMLGAIAAACLRAGMLLPLAEFVVAHGSLELPAIWISGGAGLLMAQAMLFPGRYSRRVELRLKGRSSVQIMVGIVPLLLVAGAIEAFVSPSNLPGVAKALLGLSLALALLGFLISRGPGLRQKTESVQPGLRYDETG